MKKDYLSYGNGFMLYCFFDGGASGSSQKNRARTYIVIALEGPSDTGNLFTF